MVYSYILSMGNFFNNILLAEGARDKALEQFIPLFQKRGMNVNLSWVKQTLMSKFVNEANIHNLSLGGNYYLVGVSRYYFNGDLTTNKRLGILYNNVRDNFKTDICERLDALINILRNAYIDSVGTKFEQPEDFGSLSIQQLLRKYGAKINKELGIVATTNISPAKEEIPAVSDDYTAGKNYTYEIITSFDQCRKYNGATTPGAWCITYGKQHYDGYIKMFKKRYGGIHYVIFKQNGYENIPRRVGPGFTKQKPHDAYGNSLICVLQRNDCAEPTYITSRWNHGSTVDGTQNTEADHAYTTQEFLQVIGCDSSVLQRAYEQWKALGGKDSEEQKKQRAEERAEGRADKMACLRALKYMQMLINGGTSPFSVQIPGFRITWKSFGWNPKDWTDRIGAEYLTKENAPQKYPYTIGIGSEESNRWYYTIMDRKNLLFDQFLEEEADLRGEGESFLSVGGHGWVSLFDKKRHSFLSIDGIRKFKYSSPESGIMNGMWGGIVKIDNKYIMLAVSGNQIALLNLKTMKTVKARNGSSWFESITENSSLGTNHDYRGRIKFPMGFENSLLKLVYDSASGEEYIYNTAIDSFIDPYEGVPAGWILSNRAARSYMPGERYLMFVNSKKAAEDMWASENTSYEKIYKNADNGSFFTVNGISKFTNLCVRENVVAYMVSGSDDVHYYDIRRNKPLEINGQPIVTRYGADTISEYGYYVSISLTKYIKDDNGSIRYGNSYSKIMLYNPYTGTFYHDNISGYFFKLYGEDHSTSPRRIKAYIPDGMEDKVPDNMKPNFGSGDNYNKYIIPNAQAVAAEQQTNESRMIRRIIRETLFKELRKLL